MSLQFIVVFLTFLFVAKLIVCEESKTTKKQQSFHFVFTTIPIRFNHVHETINSLLNQAISPASISIFISDHYNSQSNSTAPTNRTNLERFEKAIAYHRRTDERYARVHALEVNRDFGPIQKLLGLFLTYSNISTYLSNTNENYFIITDCDLNYHPFMVERYSSYMKQVTDDLSRVPTMFHRELRLKFHDHDIVHIQGADTFLVTDQIVKTQLAPRHVFEPKTLVPLIDYIHKICPHSYYQDDYVITALFYLAGMYVESINDKQREGVYEYNYRPPQQMHQDPNRGEREERTKKCLSANIALFEDYFASLRQLTREPSTNEL